MAISLWSLCRFTLLITFLWMLLAFLALMEAGQGSSSPALKSCGVYIAQYEQQHGIPRGLLHAISKVESGRKDGTGKIAPWPWTVNAEGQGYFFPTKDAAIAAVLKMRREGIKSIDVGCMQVNLHSHPHAFNNLNEAFDPHKNVAYAARFLTGLKNEHASWHLAVAHYHSANPIYHVPYQQSVLGAWKGERSKGDISLAAGALGVQAFPQVNRIRRLSKTKTLSLQKNPMIQASKVTVRRVVRGESPQLRRLFKRPQATRNAI